MRSTGQSLFPGPVEHSRRPRPGGGDSQPGDVPRGLQFLAESPATERAEIVGVPALCRDRDGALPCPLDPGLGILGPAGGPGLRRRRAAAPAGLFTAGYGHQQRVCAGTIGQPACSFLG